MSMNQVISSWVSVLPAASVLVCSNCLDWAVLFSSRQQRFALNVGNYENFLTEGTDVETEVQIAIGCEAVV